MPQHCAVPVMLSAGERRRLKKRARGAKTAYRDWLRAQIVLAAARGRASARDRGGPARQCGHGPQVAGPVRRPRPGRAGGPAPVRAATADQRAGTGRGGRAGLPAARRHRGAAGPLERPGTGRRDHQGGAGQPDLAILGPADPGRAPHQALAIPIVDLPARPGLRRQGHRHPRPLPGVLPGQAASTGRPDHLGGRQALHPGAPPMLPNQPASTRPAHARRARIRPRRRPGPAGRPGRAHRQGARRRHPAHHRHRTVHGRDGAGHGPGAVPAAPRACSSSWTTAPITAARQPSAGCAKPGRTPS